MKIRAYADQISEKGAIGWAIDGDSPEVPVEIIVAVNGDEHGRCRADIERPALVKSLGLGSSGRHEFRYAFDPPLPLQHDTTVVLVPAATRIPMQNGRRILRGPVHVRPPLVPIMLGSRGRAGTTMLMGEFARHPEIVVGDVYPYEVKHAAYYAAALQVLTATPLADHPDFAEEADKTWEIGCNPFNHPHLHRTIGGEHLAGLFRSSIPGRLSDLFRQFALEAYGAMAEARGKPGARFFAEKTSLADNVRYGVRRMFGEVREIILIRDPRDYMCSAKAFWGQNSQAVIDLMKITLPALEGIHQRAWADTILVRYEDLIADPVATRARVHEFIGVASPAAADTASDVPAGHATSASPSASIGRWRQDLTSEEVATCQRLFGSFMDRFGYR